MRRFLIRLEMRREDCEPAGIVARAGSTGPCTSSAGGAPAARKPSHRSWQTSLCAADALLGGDVRGALPEAVHAAELVQEQGMAPPCRCTSGQERLPRFYADGLLPVSHCQNLPI